MARKPTMTDTRPKAKISHQTRRTLATSSASTPAGDVGNGRLTVPCSFQDGRGAAGLDCFHHDQAWDMRLTCDRAIQKQTTEMTTAAGVTQGSVLDFKSSVRWRTSLNWGSYSAINPLIDCRVRSTRDT